ncbi:hypothetical protein KOR42_52330 [Thalassoglobus neptunius]|uniref:Calcineurin-like phosphoesterase domain-containing protein n=1 Tax=Thalassoglobus neptunius TaxID=1938619 RepID=A0A5C5V928_9PLAN|nr:metallophosphoesterase [Thalassoglobus neptunius]TWT35064.1 hypothetical protein KOR42_52330 [Thalassoglobus neptunius]
MRITSIIEEPFIELPFLNAGKGQGSFYVDRLPIHEATVDVLPDEVDAIVVTADLQGRERFQDGDGGPLRLLGEVLPQRLTDEILPSLKFRSEQCGVILAGDFYTVPGLDKRGGSGDVTPVWRAFAEQFKWVIGVAGNHDMFGEQEHPSRPPAANAHYLDGTTASVDGLNVVGIGGIIGSPRKLHRKSDQEFVQSIEDTLEQHPDVLVMHDGPDFPDSGLRGSPIIRQTLERLHSPLVIRGHAHWPTPLVELLSGTQVLNVDCRVVILHRHP